MTCAQLLWTCSRTRTAVRLDAPPAVLFWSSSITPKFKPFCGVRDSAGPKFLLRRLCVTTSKAGEIFRSTLSESIPTFVFRMRQVMHLHLHCTVHFLNLFPFGSNTRLKLFASQALPGKESLRRLLQHIGRHWRHRRDYFPNRAQALLVDYLRETPGDTCADWCRDFLDG